MTYSHTSRRLPTDAKIVLERAGYTVDYSQKGLTVFGPSGPPTELVVLGGCIDNTEVVRLLKLRSFNEFGHLITRSGM